MTRDLLPAGRIEDWLAEHPAWARADGTLVCVVHCGSFPAAIELVVAVADAAQAMDHHPDIDIRFDTVHFALSTHSAGGLTELDIQLGERITALAGGPS